MDISSSNNDDQLLIETSPKQFAPMIPPRNLQNQINSKFDALKPSVGTKLEGLLLNSDSDSDFDPRAEESDSTTTNGSKIVDDLFGFEPPKAVGHQLFSVTSNRQMTNGTNGLSNGYQNSPPPLRMLL